MRVRCVGYRVVSDFSLRTSELAHVCWEGSDFRRRLVLMEGMEITAEADVVGPAVSPDDPVRGAPEEILLVKQPLEAAVAGGLLAEEGQDLVFDLLVERLALREEHVGLVLMAHDRELGEKLPQRV